MQNNLSKRPRLLIVSDTGVSYDDNHEFVAFEPVVREIEHFGPLFDSITWIASLQTHSEKNFRSVEGIEVNVVPCKRIGGHGLANRLNIIAEYFNLFFLIKKEIKKADVIHSRGPAHAAIICAILSFFIRKNKIYWHKYAGDYGRKELPASFGFFRWLLVHAKHTHVTINGRWPNQKPHLLSFENPCLTGEEIEAGAMSVKSKDFSGKLNLVFIGRIEDAKGVHRILHVLSKLDSDRIGQVHLVGDGPKRKEYEKYVNDNCKQEIIFHGFLQRDEINKILSMSHVFLLPSDTEGFPKVVAEATNYGLIPIVSDVSCIGQYVIEGETGFLIEPKDENMLFEKTDNVLKMNGYQLQNMSERCHSLAELFTYSRYISRIKDEILEEYE